MFGGALRFVYGVYHICCVGVCVVVVGGRVVAVVVLRVARRECTFGVSSAAERYTRTCSTQARQSYSCVWRAVWRCNCLCAVEGRVSCTNATQRRP